MSKNLLHSIFLFFTCCTAFNLKANTTEPGRQVIIYQYKPGIVATAALTITAPADIVVTTDYWSNTATQVVLGTPLIGSVPGSVFSVFNTAPQSYPIGVTEVTWTVADNLGNLATAVQKVVVQDTQKPFINHMGEISVVNDAGQCGATVPLITPYAYDNSGLPVTITNNAPAYFEVGSRLIIWTATDAFGNSDTSTQLITVIDNEKPQISVTPLVITNDPGKCGAVSALPVPYTSDNCGVSSLTNNAPALLPVGTTLVTWTVTDKAGYTRSAVQSVTVNDTETPRLQAPANVVITTNSTRVSNVRLGNPVVSDNCGIQKVSNNAPRYFYRGTTIVIWTATDIHGNVSTAVQTVTVQPYGSKSKKLNETGTLQSFKTTDGFANENETGNLSIVVGPNPSKNDFTLQINSSHSGDIYLQVLDVSGRTVDTHSKLQPGVTIKIGQNYQTGIYYAAFRQGTERKVIPLVKVK